MADIADLYDAEIAAVGPIVQRLTGEFARRTANKKNLDELSKRAVEEFFKVGLVVEVNTMPCIIADVNGKTGPPEIVILGRVPGSKLSNADQGFELLDHEKKRAEVLKSKQTGEAFLGQKGERGV